MRCIRHLITERCWLLRDDDIFEAMVQLLDSVVGALTFDGLGFSSLNDFKILISRAFHSRFDPGNNRCPSQMAKDIIK